MLIGRKVSILELFYSKILSPAVKWQKDQNHIWFKCFPLDDPWPSLTGTLHSVFLPQCNDWSGWRYFTEAFSEGDKDEASLINLFWYTRFCGPIGDFVLRAIRPQDTEHCTIFYGLGWMQKFPDRRTDFTSHRGFSSPLHVWCKC